MPEEKKLRVYTRGTGMVPHYESVPARHGGSPTRFRSHTHAPHVGKPYITTEGEVRRTGAFVRVIGEAIELPVTAEYTRHVRDGDFYPADIETAALSQLILKVLPEDKPAPKADPNAPKVATLEPPKTIMPSLCAYVRGGGNELRLVWSVEFKEKPASVAEALKLAIATEHSDDLKKQQADELAAIIAKHKDAAPSKPVNALI